MKAIRFHEFGAPGVLRYEDAPKPAVRPGEVLVRVHAAGLNPPDWYLREGYKALPPEWRPPIELPAIPGSDVSGIVEAVAPDVTAFSPGDEVFGMIRIPKFWRKPGIRRVRFGTGIRSGAKTSRPRPCSCRCSADVGTDRVAVSDRAGS